MSFLKSLTPPQDTNLFLPKSSVLSSVHFFFFFFLTHSAWVLFSVKYCPWLGLFSYLFFPHVCLMISRCARPMFLNLGKFQMFVLSPRILYSSWPLLSDLRIEVNTYGSCSGWKTLCQIKHPTFNQHGWLKHLVLLAQHSMGRLPCLQTVPISFLRQ